ncbi:MAG: low affinity iron permease family protein [bacterium]|nr:MAG: low affinity iron permease family protein [bacterium]
MNVNSIFRKIATTVSNVAGSAYTFVIAILLIVLWVTTGPLFNYSDTWQLAINTLTTIITFLMVFLIQNTQNRDSKAIHLKLDELLKGIKGARDEVINVEELSDDILDELHNEFRDLQVKYISKFKEKNKEETHVSELRKLFDKFFGIIEKK